MKNLMRDPIAEARKHKLWWLFCLWAEIKIRWEVLIYKIKKL